MVQADAAALALHTTSCAARRAKHASSGS